MSVEGSFAGFLRGRRDNINFLLKETTREGLEELQDSIHKFTPIKSGQLKKSIKKSKIKRVGKHTYEGTVYSKLAYARYVEYGTAPHIIVPNKRQALRFTGVIAETVKHPGATGRHMFQRGTMEFRDMKLEGIMKKNLALYLAGGIASVEIS